MRNRYSLLLGVVSLLAAATPSHGQSFTPQSIHFVGAPTYSDLELANAAGLKVGQSYSADELNRRAQQLLDIGIFDKVAYKFDGSKLTYSVRTNSQTYPIEIGNLPLEVGKDFDARLHAKVPLYQGTVPAQGLLLEAIRRSLEDMLVPEGVRAQVAAELVSDPITHTPAAVKFSIDSQPVKVGALKFEGVSDFLRPQLEKDKTLADIPFDAANASAQIERTITDIYAGHGFAAAQVHAVRYGYPVLEDGSIRVPYKVTVQEGRAYRLGTVTLSHDLPIDPAEIDRLMALRSSFMPESMFVENLVSQIEMKLKGQGYLNCHVTLETHLDENAGVANYKVVADLGTAGQPGSLKPETASGGLQNLMSRQ